MFLVSDEGLSTIVKLHNALYTGLLATELRLNIPFIPHVGIGNAIDPQMCKKELADQVNQQSVSIAGAIKALDAHYEGNTVATIERVALV